VSSGDRPSLLEPLVDLVAVVLATAFGVAVSLGAIESIPPTVRVTVGFLFVFALPGYALLAALYPSMYVSSLSNGGGVRSRDVGVTLSAVEKLVLTLGLSIFAVPISVLSLDLFQVPIGPTTTIGTVAGVTVAATLVAAVRRYWAPAARDTGIAPGRVAVTALDRVTSGLAGGPSAAAVAVVILLAGAGVAGAALVDTQNGERYTELSLMTATESGNLTAGDYPQSFTVGEPKPLVVGVDNHEGTRTRYTVVITLQEYSDTDENRQLRRIVSLDRHTMTVPAGENRRDRLPITVDSVPGDGRLKLSFLLYRDGPPDNPNPANAYREAYLWVNVTR